jgi:hypothetical protein
MAANRRVTVTLMNENLIPVQPGLDVLSPFGLIAMPHPRCPAEQACVAGMVNGSQGHVELPVW